MPRFSIWKDSVHIMYIDHPNTLHVKSAVTAKDNQKTHTCTKNVQSGVDGKLGKFYYINGCHHL